MRIAYRTGANRYDLAGDLPSNAPGQAGVTIHSAHAIIACIDPKKREDGLYHTASLGWM